MSKAMDLAQAQLAAGHTKQAIANDIGYKRTAVSLYMRGKYCEGVAKIEAAIVKRYDRRICPSDGEEKQPAQCQRIALRPRPSGFPDAETLWVCCQACPHKPLPGEAK